MAFCPSHDDVFFLYTFHGACERTDRACFLSCFTRPSMDATAGKCRKEAKSAVRRRKFGFQHGKKPSGKLCFPICLRTVHVMLRSIPRPFGLPLQLPSV